MSATPTTIDALYSLGHWLIEQQRAADAVHVFRTMLMTAPQDERSWLGLGLSHERIGHDSAAARLYELGENTVRSSFRCPLARARLLRRLDANDAAEVAYDSAEERARYQDDDVATVIAAERLAS